MSRNARLDRASDQEVKRSPVRLRLSRRRKKQSSKLMLHLEGAVVYEWAFTGNEFEKIAPKLFGVELGSEYRFSRCSGDSSKELPPQPHPVPDTFHVTHPQNTSPRVSRSVHDQLL